MARHPAIGLLVLLALSSTACITRTHTDTVFDKDLTTVKLRSESKSGTVVPRGFDHPAIVSPTRLVHILSSLDVRDESEKKKPRRAAIPLTTLYKIADGMSDALAKADENQEVVVQSIEKRKQTGIFDHFYLTSFISWLEEDQLYIHFSHVDYEIEMRGKTRLPEPRVGKVVMKFRVLPANAVSPIGPHTVVVDWRDKSFRRATHIRTLPGGKVIRREILMESPIPETEEDRDTLPLNLSSKTLRKLADLEDRRRTGAISEGEYYTLRREILEADPSARQ